MLRQPSDEDGEHGSWKNMEELEKDMLLAVKEQEIFAIAVVPLAPLTLMGCVSRIYGSQTEVSRLKRCLKTSLGLESGAFAR